MSFVAMDLKYFYYNVYYRETAYGIVVIRVLHDRMLATRRL